VIDNCSGVGGEVLDDVARGSFLMFITIEARVHVDVWAQGILNRRCVLREVIGESGNEAQYDTGRRRRIGCTINRPYELAKHIESVGGVASTPSGEYGCAQFLVFGNEVRDAILLSAREIGRFIRMI
jgi:hypothetical protein